MPKIRPKPLKMPLIVDFLILTPLFVKIIDTFRGANPFEVTAFIWEKNDNKFSFSSPNRNFVLSLH